MNTYKDIWRYGKNKSTIGGAVLVIAIVLVGWLLHVEPVNPPSQTTSVDHQTVASSTNQQLTGLSSAAGVKNTPVSRANTPAPTTAPSVCDKVFTISAAGQVLGLPVSAQATNGVTSQTVDSKIVTCTYSGASDTATIIAHLAQTTVGTSANEVSFGSSRPTDAVAVSGYGSSAFWQPAKGQLNVLHDNDWYVISTMGSNAGNLGYAERLATAAGLDH